MITDCLLQRSITLGTLSDHPPLEGFLELVFPAVLSLSVHVNYCLPPAWEDQGSHTTVSQAD